MKESEDEEPNETEDFTEYTEEITFSAYSDEHRRVIVEPSEEEEEEEETETQELEGTLSVKSEEGCRVKKFVVSYETKVLKSPSPAPSHGKYSMPLQILRFTIERIGRERGRGRIRDRRSFAK